MAEMCGPSNGLSNFQKHTTVDRTLQQDRLITRQSPSQGFRSNGPNARNLDPEFAAFQTGSAFNPQEFQQSTFFPPQAIQAAGPGPVNWASDFQRMNISNAQQPVQHGFGGQAQQMDMNGGVDWNQEFSRQQNAGPSTFQAQQQQQAAGWANTWDEPDYILRTGPTHATAFSATGPGPIFQGQSTMEAQQPIEQYDDEAFERAFQEAANAQNEEIMQEQTNIQIQSQETTLEEPLSSLSQPIENIPLNQALLGADTIHDPSKPVEEVQKEDPDALARTAQQLIHNMSGDTRSKMQGSEFMKMMRGFAAGTQVVRGDDVVLTDSKAEAERLLREEGENLKIPPNSSTIDHKTDYQLFTLHLTISILFLSTATPFTRTPSRVRTLLLILLHMSSLLDTLTPSTIQHEHLSHLRSTINKIICSTHLNGLPSIRILSIAILGKLKSLLDINDDAVPSQTHNDILDQVIHANTEISLVNSHSPTDLNKLVNKRQPDNKGKDEEFETFLDAFRMRVISLIPLVQREGGFDGVGVEVKALFERVLGYEIRGDGDVDGSGRGRGRIGSVHLQRVEDILGPQAMSVITTRGDEQDGVMEL